MNVGTLMLRSIYEGYIPCILLAAIGYQTLGGGLLAWTAFVWVFGAVLTVAIASLRIRPLGAAMASNARVSGALENY